MNTIILCFAILFIATNCHAQTPKKDSTLTFKIRKPVVSETPENEKNKEVKLTGRFMSDRPLGQDTLTEYIEIEGMPNFPGGEIALFTFMKNNIRYPEVAKKKGVNGTAYISFIIDVAGNVTDAQLKKTSGNKSLDKEAIRLINSLPLWQPARKRNVAIPYQLVLPVQFKLK